jgi:hypothetical protein
MLRVLPLAAMGTGQGFRFEGSFLANKNKKTIGYYPRNE